MKKIIVVFVCVLLLFSCNKNNKSQDSKIENEPVFDNATAIEQVQDNEKMEQIKTPKRIYRDITNTPEFKQWEQTKSSLYGKTYWDITDIPECKQWRKWAGKVILSNRGYGLHILEDENKNWYFFLVTYVYGVTDREFNYKILDTINVGKLEEHEIANFMGFSLNGTDDDNDEIIGVVFIDETSNDKLYGEIINVWRADCNTEKIIPIDTEGIEYEDEIHIGEIITIKNKNDIKVIKVRLLNGE